MKRLRLSQSSNSGVITMLALLVVVSIAVFMMAKAGSGKDIASVTICEKERSATDGAGEYRIYTDKGTYVMKDVLFLGAHRTNTADDYGKIKEGVTYDIHTLGWRWGLMSWFPNIIDFTKSAEQNPDACDD